jgi:hypothetical protein
MPASVSLRLSGLSWLLVTLLAPIPAGAQPCADYAHQINWIGGITLGFSTHAVAVFGQLAFVASGSGVGGALHIVDIQDPHAPALVSSIALEGYVRRVAVAGNLALLAVDSVGLVVLDVSLPSSPVRIGTAAMRLGGYGLAATPKSVYVANYDGLQVIDISGPAAPVVRGAVDTPGYAVGVAAAGRFVYVADGFAGLRAVDVSDPTSPQLAGGVDTPGFAYGVTIGDGVVYVADWAGGVAVVSIADPAAPVLVKMVPVPGESWSVALSPAGDFAYVAGKQSGLTILDLSDPLSPVIRGTFALDGEDVAVIGQVACVVDGWESLHLLDVTYPKTISAIGHSKAEEQTWDVALAGDLAFVADRLSGFQIVDLTDPAHPAPLTTLSMVGAIQVAVDSAHAYVGNQWSGLRVVDVSDPMHPVVAGSVSTSTGVRSMVLRGDHLYIGTHGLDIVDVMDPASPQVIGGLPMKNFTAGVAASVEQGKDGEFVYLTDSGGEFWVIDVSPAESLHVAAHLSLPAWYPYGVAVSEGFAYVAAQGTYTGADFMVIDISDPLAPVLHSTLNLFGYGRDVVISDNIAYVAGSGGLEVVDVSDPSTPRIIGTWAGGGGTGVAIDDRRVVMAGGRGGLFVLPRQCPALTPSPAFAGAPVASAPSIGRPLLRVGGPQPLTPAAFPVELRFTLRQSAIARLGIYSSAGRLVHRLIETSMGPGEHLVSWNGTGASGASVASGVYFCRLDVPQGSATARLVVVR